MKREVIVQHLERSVLFKDIVSSEIARFAEVARVQIVPEGQFVYKMDEPSDIFYIIALGEAELILGREDGVTKIVGRIGPGGHFGETGILTNKVRSLSVRALSDMVIICFDKRYFRTAFLSNHTIHKQLDSALAERLRVAFLDQVDINDNSDVVAETTEADDVILFKESNISQSALRRMAKRRKEQIRSSKTAIKTQAAIDSFSVNDLPFLLTGESGTGKSIIAREIHSRSARGSGQVKEVDLREYEPIRLERKLFGMAKSSFPFVQARQAGFFEQTSRGYSGFHPCTFNEQGAAGGAGKNN